MDLLGAWRNSTSHAHKELEAKLNLLRPDLNQSEYVNLLRGYYSFYCPYENLLASQSDIPAASFYLEGRTKLQNIIDDLSYFNLAPQQIEGLPQAAIPNHWIESPAAHWGCLYVIEGSMLGGQMIVKHFAQNLKLTGGLKFYRGYGEHTMTKWKSFLAHVATLDLNEQNFSSAVKSAVEAFALLGSQLSSALSLPS